MQSRHQMDTTRRVDIPLLLTDNSTEFWAQRWQKLRRSPDVYCCSPVL